MCPISEALMNLKEKAGETTTSETIFEEDGKTLRMSIRTMGKKDKLKNFLKSALSRLKAFSLLTARLLTDSASSGGIDARVAGAQTWTLCTTPACPTSRATRSSRRCGRPRAATTPAASRSHRRQPTYGWHALGPCFKHTACSLPTSSVLQSCLRTH